MKIGVIKGWEREEEEKEEAHGSGCVCLESCTKLRLSLSMETALGKSAGLLSSGSHAHISPSGRDLTPFLL